MIVIPIRKLLIDDPLSLLAFRLIANQHPPTTRYLSPFRTVLSTKFALVHIVRTSTSDRPRNRSRPLSHHLLDLDDVVFARGEVRLVVHEGSLDEGRRIWSRSRHILFTVEDHQLSTSC